MRTLSCSILLLAACVSITPLAYADDLSTNTTATISPPTAGTDINSNSTQTITPPPSAGGDINSNTTTTITPPPRAGGDINSNTTTTTVPPPPLTINYHNADTMVVAANFPASGNHDCGVTF